MVDDSNRIWSGRRPFLKSIGVLGVTAAAGPAAASQGTSDSVGEYHQTLRNELTAASRQQRELPPGTYVYGTTEEAAIETFSLQGGGTETTISVDTDAVPITKGERLEIPADAENPSDYVYRGDITDRSFNEGDLLLAVAYVRSDSSDAEAKASFRYRYTDSGGNTAFTDNFVQRAAHAEPTGKWMRYYFPIEIEGKPGSDAVPALEFLTGYAEQTIDFGGVALFDYSDADPNWDPGVSLSVKGLPPYDYEGRSLDAEWRDAAHERIDEIRKTDIEVEVLNPGGQPMNGATVDVEMTEHEFDFGSAVSVGPITGDSEDDQIYREKFLKNFSKATVENGMKYPAWEGDWAISNEATLATLDWLNKRDIPARGHYLLWEEYTGSGGGMSIKNPESLSPEETVDLIREKIRDHANTFQDQVTEWDMHNHPIWRNNFRDDDDDGMGWGAVEQWWSVANEATDDELYTNEMGIVGGQYQRSQYHDYITRLVENDYPIDGIGFMGHHQQKYNQMLDVKNIIEGFDTFAEFDVPILVTEFDIQIFDRRNAQEVEVQKDYLRDFLMVAFSSEAVEGVVSWGFWAKDHWRPTGAYYDADWDLRPHGEKFRDLVFDQWWTDETGETDNDGVYTTRGFKGTYKITAEKGALSGETTVTIDENNTVTIQLTPPGRSGSKGSANGKGKSKGKAKGND
jgi:GH35 family endo-1,4-beta-xylanase